ncbi:MAG: LptF/LptG family permease [candidate division KSB1 bacterium]|nr:LptF/LptG family permease [candidate division KSB1 bacterium]MDZ7335628.1 LptF/LptG family permease [candidate division KSB1 bacterium]MDZ7358072.1 LptF/LptG family permease [candidate division KSB1 bacterium]MDZ7376092.1 LptF/LptG family permease [candidate division KSB1 bacterium]MDZ7399848.1 LptF/LptG family permease [candidate division KSB1 bacterium]
MYILSKHILRQHVGPFLFGFFIITLLFILNLVFKELGRILSKGLEIWVIAEFFALNLAWIVALAVPMAVLMASLMSFGQFSADNEITAIKASGISVYRIILPVLIAAALLSVFLIWFNNEVLPDANHRLRLLARDIAIKKPTVSLEPGYLYQDIPNLAIRVEHLVEEKNLSHVRGVIIYDKNDPQVNRSIVAERGEIFVNQKSGLLQITLFNGEIHEVNIDKLENYTRIQFEKHVLTIAIPNMVLQRSESSYRGDREQSAQMMRQEVANNLALIEKRRQNLMSTIQSQINHYFSGYSMPSELEAVPTEEMRPELRFAVKDQQTRILNRGSSISSPPKVAALSSRSSSDPKTHPLLIEDIKYSDRVQLNLSRQIRVHQNLLQRIKSEREINRSYELANNKLLVEIYKKYSIPFACIVFVLIGAPLGIMARRGNMAVGGGISLVFFIIYWVFLIGGEELADRDLLSPFLAMWLANFIVGAFGIYLLIRTAKEASFINFDIFVKLIPKRLRRKLQ